MAIGAPNVALLDFLGDGCDGVVAAARHHRNIITLVPANMIELKHHWIGFATIYARMQKPIS